MKKIIGLIFTVILIVSLVACGQQSEGGNNEALSNSSNTQTQSQSTQSPDTKGMFNIIDVIDVNDYDLEEEEPYIYDGTGMKSIAKTYTLKEENEQNIENKVNIGGTEITLSETTVTDFLAYGWTIVGGNTADNEVKSLIITNATVKNQSGEIATIYAANKTDRVIDFSECLITGIKIDYKLGETSDFSVCGSINKKSSYSDITKVFGKAERISITEFYENDEYQYSYVHFAFEEKVKAQNSDVYKDIKFSFQDNGDTNEMLEFSYKTSEILVIKE